MLCFTSNLKANKNPAARTSTEQLSNRFNNYGKMTSKDKTFNYLVLQIS